MTGFNNNGKFVPSTPKTYTVVELRDTQQPVKKSNLSVAARSKIINRSGSNYLSPWAETDIDEANGYGPCGICSKTTQWRRLYLACPGVKDGERCGNPNASYWYHSTDSGQAEISNKAKIRCSSCYTTAHMSYWSFSCSRHEGRYYDSEKVTFRKSLNTVINAEESIGTEITDDIITYMSAPEHRSEARSGW